jgi:mannose-6-phosphate isomerase-like protein (cupin superfamily)
MKTVRIDDLPAAKIKDRQGLFQKDIFDAKDGAKRFSFHLSIMEEGGHGSLHSHPHSEHVLLVVSGSLRVCNESESHELGEGMSILIMPGELHEIINTRKGVTQYYVIYAPQR